MVDEEVKEKVAQNSNFQQKLRKVEYVSLLISSTSDQRVYSIMKNVKYQSCNAG